MLLFGPQALSFTEESASELREALLELPKNQWIMDTVAELSDHWTNASEECSAIRITNGAILLQDLTNWLKTGKFAQASFPLPNILLTPLVVITQLVQYLRYLDFIQPGSDEQGELHGVFKNEVETLGFCTGLLSALAVSSSANRVELQNYGSVAIRLAMLIGAVVDARDIAAGPDGKSKSLSLAWDSNETAIELMRIVKSSPEVGDLYRLFFDSITSANIPDMGRYIFQCCTTRSESH